MIGHWDALNVLYTWLIIVRGYYGTFRGDFSLFKTLILTLKYMNSANLGPALSSDIYLSVAILENGRHLGCSIGQCDRMDLITIEMSHAIFGVCITMCTIHPRNARYLLHCNSVTTYPKDNVTTYPKDNVTAYPKDNVTTYPKDNVTTYPKDNVTAYPKDNVTTYPKDNVTTYPKDNVTTYPKDNVTTYPKDNVTTYPKDNVTTYPNVISFTKSVIVEKYGVSYI